MSIGNFDTENITRQTSIAMWLSWGVMVMLLIWCFMIPPRGENAEYILKACVLVYTVIPSAIVREALKEGKGAKIKVGQTEINVEHETADPES